MSKARHSPCGSRRETINPQCNDRGSVLRETKPEERDSSGEEFWIRCFGKTSCINEEVVTIDINNIWPAKLLSTAVSLTGRTTGLTATQVTPAACEEEEKSLSMAEGDSLISVE